MKHAKPPPRYRIVVTRPTAIGEIEEAVIDVRETGAIDAREAGRRIVARLKPAPAEDETVWLMLARTAATLARATEI